MAGFPKERRMELKTIPTHGLQAARFRVRQHPPGGRGVPARDNGRALWSGCGQRPLSYDRPPPRRFRFVPVLCLPTFLYTLRRVTCPRRDHTKVVRMSRTDGKQRATRLWVGSLPVWPSGCRRRRLRGASV